MRVQCVTEADIYRDGGSYGVQFRAEDGEEYQLWMEVNRYSDDPTHLPPVIMGGSALDQEIAALTWDEAVLMFGSCEIDPTASRIYQWMVKESATSTSKHDFEDFAATCRERFAEAKAIIKAHGRPDSK
ncbi:MAG: hypothetical protein ACTHK7_18175 [Aureliella sp.]